ncbi:MAG: NTF2 fold immunity protein [Planctomycetaceae bacterium]
MSEISGTRCPAETVAAFLTEMNGWESLRAVTLDARRRGEISWDEAEQRGKDGIRAFWDDFVSKSVDGTMRWTTFQTPPEYDPAKQTIVATREISPSVAEVETHDTRRDYRFIYVLVKEAGVWKIQRKFRVDEYDYRDKEPI